MTHTAVSFLLPFLSFPSSPFPTTPSASTSLRCFYEYLRDVGSFTCAGDGRMAPGLPDGKPRLDQGLFPSHTEVFPSHGGWGSLPSFIHLAAVDTEIVNSLLICLISRLHFDFWNCMLGYCDSEDKTQGFLFLLDSIN